MCTVIVITRYPGTVISTDSTYISKLSPDKSWVFAKSDDAIMILANPDMPIAVDPKQVQITTNPDGNKQVIYESF